MVYVWGSMFTVPDLAGLGKNRDSEFKKKNFPGDSNEN